MKTKLILLFIALTATITSCKKEDDKDPVITREDYFGTFLKSSTCVGTFPGTSTHTFTISAGSGNNEISIYDFTDNGETFIGVVNGSNMTFTDNDGYTGTGSLSGNILTIDISYGTTSCSSTCTRQ